MMFRLDHADAATKNPHQRRLTRRFPGNVPYVVDNLWEWRRPPAHPSRRHCVCASPSPDVAREAGGIKDGKVFRINPLGPCTIAQISQKDAREHPDCKALTKLLLSLLGESWVNDGIMAKQDAGRLWIPCLTQREIDYLFSAGRLADIRNQVWDAITFWNEASLFGLRDQCPFPEGEIFFEAAQWNLDEL